MKLNRKTRRNIATPYFVILLGLQYIPKIFTAIADIVADWFFKLDVIVEYNLGEYSGIKKLIKWVEAGDVE